MKYVNCIKEECTHYCGRKSSFHKAKGKPIDLSILGNPIPLFDEAKRDAVINEYGIYLMDFCKRNEFIPKILEMIPNDAILGCFCAPKRCHCEVIIELAKFFKSQLPNK